MSALSCRFCGAPLRKTFVDLGQTPLANSFVPVGAPPAADPSFPLHARVCESCLLVQVEDVAPPEVIFADYAYFSSFATSWVDHARRYAEMTRARFGLGGDSMVVEVACNDGYLLRHFVEAGVPCLGVEPAETVAAAARALGVPVEVAFFGMETAGRLRGQGKAADLIAANNVLAHVPDLNDFVAGLAHLLKPGGVLTVEFPHIHNLIEQNQFDTIYHEHFCYFSLGVVERVFARHGLSVFDVETLPTHGGSLRVFARLTAGAARPEGEGLAAVRALEAKAGLDDMAAYEGYEPKVVAARDALIAFLDQAKAEGKSVAAYGAAAKGNTLLNYCGVGPDRIGYVVDRNPAKQGKLLPGSRIPIHSPERLMETRPDYILILPWNLGDEIAASMGHVRDWGGRFFAAIPSLREIV